MIEEKERKGCLISRWNKKKIKELNWYTKSLFNLKKSARVSFIKGKIFFS
jgi:hypothetical protein